MLFIDSPVIADCDICSSLFCIRAVITVITIDIHFRNKWKMKSDVHHDRLLVFSILHIILLFWHSFPVPLLLSRSYRNKCCPVILFQILYIILKPLCIRKHRDICDIHGIQDSHILSRYNPLSDRGCCRKAGLSCHLLSTSLVLAYGITNKALGHI